MSELYTRLFVDSDRSQDHLVKVIAATTAGSIDGDTVDVPPFVLEVRESPFLKDSNRMRISSRFHSTSRSHAVRGHREIEVFQDAGFDGLDPIYRAVWNGSRWRVRFARLYEYKTDGPIVPDALMLSLPGITSPPTLTPYR